MNEGRTGAGHHLCLANRNSLGMSCNQHREISGTPESSPWHIYDQLWRAIRRFLQ